MEFTHYTEYAFNYIRTRMRSPSKYKSFIRCSLNPHPTHFVHKYLDIFIKEDGFADTNLSCKSAYYIMHRGSFDCSFDLEYLKEKYPQAKPRTFTFVPSSLSDNPEMLSNNPDYADDLAANDPANAAMLLDGNWKYSPAANGYWERDFLKGKTITRNQMPSETVSYRAWDKAASKPAKEGGDSKQSDPDYTASIRFDKDRAGNIYVLGDYVKDNEGKQIARLREGPALRDAHIARQADTDGNDVYQILPRDNGQGGVAEYQAASRALQELGFIVKQDKTVSNQSKSKRFEPFVSACYTGSVFWVKDSFDPDVWDYMILELENFDGAKNNGYHDDLVDCFSSAYTTITATKRFTNFGLPSYESSTNYSRHMR